MSAFSDEMAAVALELLTEFGQLVTFTRTTEGAYSTATLTTGPATTSTYTGYVVPVDNDKTERDTEIVQESSTRIYLNATSTAPAIGDSVSLNSVDYRILEIRKHVVNGEVVLYDILLRI